MELNEGEHRFGFVAVAGRPNVGKSTLVNRMIGRDLSIVTSKAQTTRHQITAIHTQTNAQIVFLDAPGFLHPRTLLDKSMVSAAVRSIEQADWILFVTTPEREIPADDLRLLKVIKSVGTRTFLVVNKADLAEPSRVAGVRDEYSRLHAFEGSISMSALRGSGPQELVEMLVAVAPRGPAFFPEDDISDLPLRFFAAEIIRAEVVKMTGKEIPYKTAVVVEAFREERERVFIQGEIHVERESQKRILIGKGGAMIKKIGTAARHELQEFVGSQIHLELFVKVTPRWTTDPARLKELGY